jgi:hypothetical protein
VSAFPADIVPDDPEDRSGLNDLVSAALLGLSVMLWVCFWGTVWLSSLVYVALHHRDEQSAGLRLPICLPRSEA